MANRAVFVLNDRYLNGSGGRRKRLRTDKNKSFQKGKIMKKTSKILALALVAVMLLTSLMGISASAAEGNVYTLDANDLSTVTSSVDNTRIPAGTKDYFTIILKNGGKIKDANYSFEDGSKFTKQINFGGKLNWSDGKVNKSAIEFTTASKGTVKVWWISDKDGAYLVLENLAEPKVEKAKTEVKTAGKLHITEFEIPAAGTWYVAPAGNNGSICKVEVTEIPDCAHIGGTATCKDLAVCDLCGKPYGELSTEHKFDNGSCTVCGEPDPDACQHTNKNAATCLLPETCANCGETFGEALGHDMGEATCTSPATCKRDGCGHTDGKALGHTLTFVTTYPTADTKGKTTASCSVCNEDFDFGEVSAMGKGTYVLEGSDLEGIAQYSYFDGQVKVVGGVFGCHLSEKYRTDNSNKTFKDEYKTSIRMNFGGESSFCNNGEGDDAVRNGGYKNFIEITVTSDATITVHWVCAKDGRTVAIYDTEGKVVTKDEVSSTKDSLYISKLKVPAGTYLIGTDCTKAESGGGNYFFKVTVEVHDHEFEDATCETPKTCTICGYEEGEPAGHSFDPATCETPKTCTICGYEEGSALGHTWKDATCTAPKTCSVCGETEGEALGHTWTDATCTTPKTCSACGATEGDGLGHNYDRGTCGECGGVDPEYTIWNRIVDMIMAFIQRILGFFKKA